jgi:hypothetical protein
MIPVPLMTELRAEAAKRQGKPTRRAGLGLIVLIWLATLAVSLIGCANGFKADRYRSSINTNIRVTTWS